MDENITVTALYTTGTNKNTGKYYDNGKNWRIYQNEKPEITISGGANVTIVSVKITYTVSNTGVMTCGGSQVKSGTLYSVNGESVVFSVGNTGTATNGQIRITQIDVNYAVESASGTACAHENWSDFVVTTPATCSERGVETATCEDCGETKTRQIPVDPTLHVYNETITTPATCTQPGLKTFTCECGATKTEEIPATGHNYNSVVTAPTCTTGGYTTHTCSVCGDTYKDNETEAKGHTEVVDAAVEATCTTAGKTEGKHCSVCGEVIVAQEEVKALGHDEVEHEAKAPTCTEKGWDAYVTCSRCDYSTYVEKAATGHNYNSVVTAPTCTTGGYTTHTCSVCGDSYIDSETEAKGHTEETIPAVAPGCESEGLTEGKKCSVCGTILVAPETVDALGHKYESAITKAPTCTEEGVRTYTCQNDNSHTYTEVIEKLSHTPAAAVEENREEATCTQEGSYDSVVYCTVCGEELSRETKIIDKVAHSSVEIPAVAPTCTEKGKTAGAKCSVCGEILTAQTDVDALGHEAETVAGKDSTCTETGLTDGSKCSVCGEILVAQETIPALGHTEVIDEAVAPTCTETGLTEGKHCSVCGEVLVAQTVVDALGHTEDIDAAVAPTCTETGLTEGKHCSVCGEVLVAQTVVDALGHTVVVDEAVEATCTTAGKTEGKHCSVCGEVLVAQTVVDALGHEWEWVIDTPATVTSTGLKHEECTRCDATQSHNTIIDILICAHTDTLVHNAKVDADCENAGNVEYWHCTACGKNYSDENGQIAVENITIPATGHNYNSVVTAPTCTADGYTTHTCANCGDTYTDTTVDALGHTVVIDEAVAPTCTETGLTEGKHCSVCGEVLVAQTVVEAKGHRWGNLQVTSATCTVDGYITITCGDCGIVRNSIDHDEAKEYLEKYPYFDLEAKGHDYQAVVTAPTCTADGYTTHTCSKCGDSYVDTYVDALGHTEGEVVVENNVDATCTEAGSYDNVVYCATCKVELSRETITVEAKGHRISDVNVISATCTEAGHLEIGCGDCEGQWDSRYDQVAKDYLANSPWYKLDPKGHDLVTAYEVVVVEGVNTLHKVTKCVREGCEHIAEDVTVDTTNSVEVANEADMRTVLQNGFDATLTSDIILEDGSIEIAGKTVTVDLNGHNITVTGEKAGVCEVFYVQADGDLTINGNGKLLAKDNGAEHVITLSAVDGAVVTINGGDFVSEGSTAVYATRGAKVNIFGGTYSAVAYNGQMFTLDVNEAEAVLGVINVYGGTFHNFDPANHTTDGTYTNKVMDGYHSIKDGDNYVVSAHTEVVDAAVDATCTATGLTEGKHCSVCGEILVAQEEIALKAHTAEVVAGKPATCTETGLEDGSKCSVCGKVLVEQEVINALGHDFVAGEVVAPKCEEQGYTIYDCSRCDATENRDYVVATGHTEVVDSAVAPTCTATGLTEGKHCSVCEKVLVAQEVVAATGHTEETLPAVDATCTETGLTEGKKCSVCNEVLVAQEEVAKTAHNYIDGVGICSVCGANESTVSCTFAENGYANAEQVSEVSLSDVFVVTFGKGTTATAYYSDGTSIRLYAKGTLTVTGDKTIVKIIFEYGTGDKSNEFTADCGEFDGDTWTGNSNQVKFTVGGTSGHRRIKTITVFYAMEKADCVSCSSTVYGTNDTHHWSICDACAFKYSYEQHSFTVENTDANYLANAATCTSAAKYYYSCECGVKGDDTFTSGDPIAHNFTAKVENENTIKSSATCQHADIYWYSCVDCGAISNEKTFESGSFAEHNDANADGSCDDCGAALHEHSYGSWYKVDETSHRHDCNVEGCTNYEIAEHSYNEMATAPTCTADGYTTYTCKEDCGYSYVVTDEGSATGHTIVNNSCSGGCGLTYTAAQAHSAVLDNDATVLAGTFVYTGVVASVDTAYSSQNSNITVTINIDGTLIKCYKLEGTDIDKIGVGDSITVSGKLSNYSGKVQFSAGSQMTAYSVAQFAVTFDNVENGAISELASGATFKRGSTVTFKLTADEGYVVQNVLANSTACTAGEDGNYSFVITADTIITVVIAEEGSMPEPPAVQNTTASVTIADYATANGWANSTQYLQILVDSNITVTADGGANTGKYYTSGTNWRIYQNENPSVTISANEGITIVSVKVNYAAENTGVLTLSGENISSGTSVDVNAQSITFGVGNTGSATNGQVRITGIEVVYTAGSVESCEHANKETITGTAATCTDSGLTDGTKCKDCGMVIVKQDEIPALGHNFVDGKCSRCDATQSTAETWQKASSISVGDTIIIVCESKTMELEKISGSYGAGVGYSGSVGAKWQFTVEQGSSTNTYAFVDANGNYLSWTSGNSLTTSTTKNANSSWKVTFSGDNVTIANAMDNNRKLQWNASSPRFACYTSSQTAIQIYVYK